MDKPSIETLSEKLEHISHRMLIPTVSTDTDAEETSSGIMPSIAEIKEIMQLVRKIVFPEFFSYREDTEGARLFTMNILINQLCSLLQRQIAASLHFCRYDDPECRPIEKVSFERSLMVMEQMPEIKRQLMTDVNAVFRSDPAVSDETQVVLCYPSIRAMVHHRFAHYLNSIDIPLLPRIISEMAHSKTGIDIHPGARIGDYFAIDHGTGVVIGETCIIGNHVTIYQGVTLGAKNFVYDDNGHPINVPRHPIIGDNVTIYANASILGRITIGHDSVIGGNVWVTSDLPPFSRIVQGRPANVLFTDGAGI